MFSCFATDINHFLKSCLSKFCRNAVWHHCSCPWSHSDDFHVQILNCMLWLEHTSNIVVGGSLSFIILSTDLAIQVPALLMQAKGRVRKRIKWTGARLHDRLIEWMNECMIEMHRSIIFVLLTKFSGVTPKYQYQGYMKGLFLSTLTITATPAL